MQEFAIIAEMLVNKAGISTLYVTELFSVNKDTAWRVMHKIREAMAKDMDGIKLSGIVECDEAGIGGDTNGFQTVLMQMASSTNESEGLGGS